MPKPPCRWRCRDCTVCGNQRCELGEACSETVTSTVQAGGTVTIATTASATTANSSTCCLADCPVVVQSCAVDGLTGLVCSGHGSCLTGVGVCRCFDGYGGDACSTCNSQYTAIADAGSGGAVRCVLLAGMYTTCLDGVRDGLEQGVDCGGVCRACNGTSSGTDIAAAGQALLLKVLTTTTVIGALLTVTVVVMVIVRRRGAHRRVRRRSVVTTQLGGVPRHSRGSIQASAVCPVAVDTSMGDRRRSSDMGDRVARIIGRNSIDGGTLGGDGGRLGSVTGGYGNPTRTVVQPRRASDAGVPSGVAMYRGTAMTRVALL